MASLPLHYIDLRVFCRATEAEDRVVAALRQLLPDDVPIERAETTGHFGDPIVVCSARVETADEMRAVLDALGSDLRAQLRAELDDRVDDNCALFARLDKQAAYEGMVRFGPGITLRAKVEAYPAKRQAAIENAREMLDPRV